MPTVKITLWLDATKYLKVQKHKINDSILTLTKHNKKFLLVTWRSRHLCLHKHSPCIRGSEYKVFKEYLPRWLLIILPFLFWSWVCEWVSMWVCGQLCQGFVMTVVLWFDSSPGDPPGGRSGWRRASRGSCWTGSQHWIASRTGWSSCSSWDRINQKKN